MILIIDDDSAVRSSLSCLLKHAGFETQAVAMPQEALDIACSDDGYFVGSCLQDF